MLWAGGNGRLLALIGGSQGPERHSTCILQYELWPAANPTGLKTWLLTNRLNVEKPEREAGARTHSQ